MLSPLALAAALLLLLLRRVASCCRCAGWLFWLTMSRMWSVCALQPAGAGLHRSNKAELQWLLRAMRVDTATIAGMNKYAMVMRIGQWVEEQMFQMEVVPPAAAALSSCSGAACCRCAVFWCGAAG